MDSINEVYDPVLDTKQYRVDLDAILQRLKNSPRNSRERSLTITKLQEAIMWLGMDLKDQNIAPTADGIKL